MNQSILDQFRVHKWRVIVFFIVMTAVLSFYVYRLFSLQVIEGAAFLDQANENRIREISESTQRGIIYDRNGFVLARNIASYNVVITPAFLPDVDTYNPNGDMQRIYRELSALIDIPVTTGNIDDEEAIKNFTPCYNDFGLKEIVYIGDTNAPFSPVQVKCDIDPETAMVIREKKSDWPGVDIEIVAVRDYPTGELTSEVIGFLGPIPASQVDYYEDLGFVANRDKVGYAGVEQYLDENLLGTNGKRVVEVDGAGQLIRDLEVPITAVPGNNIKLTIDTRLQAAAKTALLANMQRYNLLKGVEKYNVGAVIAMNPKTGEILALVSYPTFENNRLARIIPAYYYNQLQLDPRKPLFNHAISAEHPPGSVFKLAPAVGILNENVVRPETTVFDPGKITILEQFSPNDPGRQRDYVCYTYKDTGAGHGTVDFIRGVALSCDVYFYKVGGGYGDEVPVGLNIWRIGEYSKALGYGEITGIELPGEMKGLIPDPTWKRINVGENWSTGDTYIATMGQGYVLSTPIQVLVSFATIANDGIMMKPTLVKEILDAEGNVIQPFTPIQIRDITKDPVIQVYDENFRTTGELKTVEPWVIEKTQEALREVVVDGTSTLIFEGETVPSAGKTGTAEYCDNIAQEKNICFPGSWPAHAWYVGYAPYDDPEIAVVVFVYDGDEGAVLSGPVVRDILETYFALKAVDQGLGINQ
ncbi:MAG: penicillin-binding protein 2 [Chloroflexi bacterium HGW-Chloroflexi-3]|nr:MAG: penicillin-binding protein 2 [Chloroflexi bacterium HGW-Chloroflexi-3]